MSLLSDLTDWLEDIASQWWFLIVIFGIALLDSVIPIVPSETTVIIGGVAAGAGDQSLVLVILAGALGAFCGDNMAYSIGRWWAPWFNRRAEQPGEDATTAGLGAPSRSASAAGCC